MREVRYWVSENLARRLDLLYFYKFTREVPPWAGRLKFAVEKDLRRLYALDSTFQARIMYQAPRFTTAVSRHTKAIMQYFRNHSYADLTRGSGYATDKSNLDSIPYRMTLDCFAEGPSVGCL